MNFNKVRKNLKKDFAGFEYIKLAVASDFSIQIFSQAIRGVAYEKCFDVQVVEGAYDQMEAELINSNSDVLIETPQFICIFPCVQKLYERFNLKQEDEKITFANEEFARLKILYYATKENSNARIIVSNFIEFDDMIYGNYGATLKSSFAYQVRQINILIEELIEKEEAFYLLNVRGIVAQLGINNAFDERLYYLSKLAFNREATLIIAERLVDIIGAIKGRIKKCIVLDLDNTLWGGVIGDDGLYGIILGEIGVGNAFVDFQKWLRQLAKRGVLLAVCSKNNYESAVEPFEKHTDMVLKLEDIAVFIANWEDKATNIINIQQTLNIGMDSLVFIDDNFFERELVRSLIPEITVPEMPNDPTRYLEYLRGLNLFEVASISREDKNRTEQYKAETQRKNSEKKFGTVNDYLKSLQMKAQVKPFDSFSIPRVAQLSQRSNQFNLRTIRYTDSDIKRMSENSENYITFTVSLTDKFGDQGIIAVVILEKRVNKELFINTLLMSCRVLKRGIEEFVMNEIFGIAKDNKLTKVIGEFIETKKNVMVKNFFSQFGFRYVIDKGEWELETELYENKKTQVEKDVI